MRNSIWVLMLILCGMPAGAENWHEDAFFGLHYDLHPNAGDTELGRETSYDHIRAELEKVHPDFVQYDCKGHPGYAGYPTKVGSPSPGIVNDALKIWRQVTRDMGIPLSIHYSGVWDTRAIELHPEWARIQADGSRDPNNTCPLSRYTEDLLIPQLLEVIENYQIDGMWVDGECWASYPCYCEQCKSEYKKRTGKEAIPMNAQEDGWQDWLAFHRKLFVEHVAQYTEAIHAKYPNVLVCSNWMYSVRMPEEITVPVDYLSGDFDPSFGAERASAEARFIGSRGKTWDLMAWSFLRTGNQLWTTKTTPHLCQEVSTVLAQGGAVFIYDQPQRSGRLTGWHQDILSEVAAFCRQRQELCHKTETLPQVAILHSQSYFYRNNDPLFGLSAHRPMEGALHAVLENGYSADILNEDQLIARMAGYPLVIVPEQDQLPDRVISALKEYVQQGGHLLISGSDAAREYPELTGCEASQEKLPQAWVPAGNGCVPVEGGWCRVKTTTARELAPLLNQQEPSVNLAGSPAATVNSFGKGTVVAIHGPVFRAYNQSHYPLVRRFIGDAIAALQSGGLIHVDGPWWIEMSARTREGKNLIQLVNRSTTGYLAPNRHMVESVPNTGAFTVTFPMEKKPKRCYLAPDPYGLEWTWQDGVLTAQIADLAIHNVLVVE